MGDHDGLESVITIGWNTHEGQSFEAGTVYIGEPAAHLVLAERSFGELVQDPGFAYRNRTIDLLFRSVAAHAKPHVIGVVLSGSLDDGSRGLASIHAAGGLTMVITPDSPTPPGMPENAIGYDGPIDLIGSPTQIAAGISRAMAKIPSLPGLEVHPVQQTSQLDAEDPSS
jgi:two-component system chemotaxis response regulator CheB